MNPIEAVTLSILGLALVAGVPAVLYFFLPRSVLEAATRHGRYVGLGARSRLHTGAPGDGVTHLNSPLGQWS
jgi:hypothetical protein